MFLDDKNDRPLMVVLTTLVGVLLVGWAQSPPLSDTSSGPGIVQAVRGPSLPADYGAPALPAMTATPIPKSGTLVDIVRDPADLPPAVGARGPRRVNVVLRTEEVTGMLNDGATYHYWTFDGKVPGPFLRVRVGDLVSVRLQNDAGSTMVHNADFHAVIGPGGGAKATEANPGEARGFEFKAMHPGLFVYHCAAMPAAQHIANGMYGLILVEPDGGLPKVDHEFYVMQGEFYTDEPFGARGELQLSYDKLMDERPDYYVFNGAVGALATHKPLHATTGQTVRIFFGDAGPNKTSSLHMIGEVFTRAYNLGSLTASPLTDVQTIEVPPGGAAVVDAKLDVPGKYLLVDHALARVDRGLSGALLVDGPANAELFHDDDPVRSTMVMGH